MKKLKIDSKKKWYVIHYHLKDELRLIMNLTNQNFKFYIPKILISKNKQIKNSALFPGYGFVKCPDNQVNSLNYTKGLKYVLRNGLVFSNVSCSLISEIQEANKDYQKQPLTVLPKLHSDVIILNGPLKGNLVKVMGFSNSDRVKILFNILGRSVFSETLIDNLKIS